MSMCFQKHCPNAVTIIDCFEIHIQILHNQNDQATTHSSYQSRNIVKYLIFATPQGTINFISRSYAGRKSDKLIVQDSGYLDCQICCRLVPSSLGASNLQPLCSATIPPPPSFRNGLVTPVLALFPILLSVQVYVEL